jgi:hypothetical protein
LFLQQPLGQVLALQVAGLLQVPLSQVWPDAQAWHAPPAFPHAATSVPGLQVLPAQQPVQVAGEQSVVQLPCEQLSPTAHFLHARPPLPQALVLVPLLHWSPSQQPLHELDVQVHLPLTQLWLEAQGRQIAPPTPQAWIVFPGLHLPPASQQPPGQLWALQVCGIVAQLPA